jgi:hypothetical protein
LRRLAGGSTVFAIGDGAALIDQMETLTPISAGRPLSVPDRLVLLLLVAVVQLFTSNWLGWPHWHRGYAVVTCVATVAAALLVMALWWALALMFRRRFQFGIWSLLALCVVAAVPCSWMAVEIKNAKEQRVAAETIENARGSVLYNHQFDPLGHLIVIQQGSPGSPWLCKLLGDDLFASAVWVSFVGDAISHSTREQFKVCDYLGDVVHPSRARRGRKHRPGATQGTAPTRSTRPWPHYDR